MILYVMANTIDIIKDNSLMMLSFICPLTGF
ncbi:hypothetical protein EcE24377A_1778 [Escherichia coli O139:H28 str. E24377A]|uniref:Uncharacterized protein n=1 Tax=Escherichia coli O139:H28 (strain E24377A / ETEC) TaxID=331111 RepID=A7ZM30_ECO24|nr:hypothetical protein EcE24377A_1778 [Escherichia coli O139:H28 str. E24377A]